MLWYLLFQLCSGKNKFEVEVQIYVLVELDHTAKKTLNAIICSVGLYFVKRKNHQIFRRELGGAVEADLVRF